MSPRTQSRTLLGLAVAVKGAAWLDLVPLHAVILIVLGLVIVSDRATRAALVATTTLIWATTLAGVYTSHHFTLLGLLTLEAAFATTGPTRPLRPAELVAMVQVSAVYFWAGVWKLNAEFLSGSVIHIEWELSWLLGPGAAPQGLATVASITTIVAEIGAAISLWVRAVPIRVVFGVLITLHVGMVLTVGSDLLTSLELVAFALACGSVYPFFAAWRANSSIGDPRRDRVAA